MGAARQAGRTSLASRLALLVLGVVLVAALEGILRWLGLGGHPPLVRELLPDAAGGATWVEVNPRLAEPWFTSLVDGATVPPGGHRGEILQIPKPAGSTRVIVVGASSVHGFPMPANLTAVRFLERMLAGHLSSADVEVLNLGVTAVASYPVRVIAGEALAQLEPDALVVYAGHNEFFGAGGVASTQWLGSRPATIAVLMGLRSTALWQGLEAMLHRTDTLPVTEDLIRVMARAEPVEPGGELHRRARRLLAANLEAICLAAGRRGVPVVLSTLASNERDLVPIASFGGDLPDERTAVFERRLETARALEASDARRLEELRALTLEAPRHATAAWAHAVSLEALEPERATEAYSAARDLDAMPWRAPSILSDAAREAARACGADVADVERFFRDEGGRAPGWDLFTDHVHPSLRGQAALAEAWLAALLKARPDWRGAPSATDWRLIAADLGANELEHYLLLRKMAVFFRVGPMAKTNGRAGDDFERSVVEAEARMDGVSRAAVAGWGQASDEAGRFLPISWFGGLAAAAASAPERAERYFAAAASQSVPWSGEQAAAALMAGRERLRQGRPPNVGADLARARSAVEAGRGNALLLAAVAGLAALEGDPAQGRAAWRRAESMAADLDATSRIYYRALPAPGDLAGGV